MWLSSDFLHALGVVHLSITHSNDNEHVLLKIFSSVTLGPQRLPMDQQKTHKILFPWAKERLWNHCFEPQILGLSNNFVYLAMGTVRFIFWLP